MTSKKTPILFRSAFCTSRSLNQRAYMELGKELGITNYGSPKELTTERTTSSTAAISVALFFTR